MGKNRLREQHIAVFGESGSGKTVLVSSFYGSALEAEFDERVLYEVTADNGPQGRFLYKTFLDMKDSAEVPLSTRFKSESYSFSVKLKNRTNDTEKDRPFDGLRLVWHDYPGEWFEQDIEGPEGEDRSATFQKLLRSQVALVLVDGQKLQLNAGEEERYLKLLFRNLSHGLEAMKDDVLNGGKPLVQFPRIWIIALSKADMLPEMDVLQFRDLVIGKSGQEIDRLERVLGEFIQESDVLSVGDDFLLLSSAKFEPGKIEVSDRTGIDLVLPLAAALPYERYERWLQTSRSRGKVYAQLLEGTSSMGAALGGVGALATKLSGARSKVLTSVGLALTHFGGTLNELAAMGGDKLRIANQEAAAKQQHLRALLTGFRISMENAETKRVLRRSRK